MSSIDPPLSSSLRGEFKLESTSIVILEKIADFETAREKIGGLPTSEGMDALMPQFAPGKSVSLHEISPLLTYIHEQDHLKVLSSTPVGLLLWRIQQCLSVDAFYLKKRLPNVTSQGFRTFLDAWLSAIDDPTHNTGNFADIVKETATGAKSLRLFLDLLLNRSTATVGQFVRIANDSFHYLARRSGLSPEDHARWETRLPPDQPLLPTHLHSLLEIVEASARARELTNLVGWRVSQPSVDNWRNRSIFGVYSPAFNYLMHEIGSSAWSKTAIDLALGTPIDLATGKNGDVVYVEDVLPSYRLPRIVQSLRQSSWGIDMADQRNLRRLFVELPKSIGLEAVTDTYERLRTARYSLGANWGGKIISNPPNRKLDELLEIYFGGEAYIKFLEEQYRRNFRLRSTNPAAFITKPRGTLHEPILTFFSDRLVVSSDHVGNSPGLLFGAFHQFCDHEIGRAYIFGGDENAIPLYQQLFRQRCIEGGVPEAFVNMVLEISSNARLKHERGFNSKELVAAFDKYGGKIEAL
jgi:hypothetical protein